MKTDLLKNYIIKRRDKTITPDFQDVLPEDIRIIMRAIGWNYCHHKMSILENGEACVALGPVCLDGSEQDAWIWGFIPFSSLRKLKTDLNINTESSCLEATG